LHRSAALLDPIREHPEVDRVGEVVPLEVPPLAEGSAVLEKLQVFFRDDADRGALRGGEGLAVVEERDGDVLHGPSIPFLSELCTVQDASRRMTCSA